jgi:hypothetical protein
MRARRNRLSERSMTKEQSMRIGHYLLVGALFGAPTMLVNSGADAHPHHHHRLQAAHFIRPDVSVPAANHVTPAGTPKPEDHGTSQADDAFTKSSRNTGRPGQLGTTKTGSEGTPGGIIKDASTGAPAKDTTSPDAHMKDLGPVDTRISVEPRLHGVKPDRIRGAKTKFRILPGHGRQLHPRLAPGTVVRNAIGVTIHPKGTDNKGNQGKVPDQAGARGTPKAAAGNGATGVATLELRPQASNPVPTNGLHAPATTTMNHSSIGGSIMVRSTTAPGVIGGPAKNVVGALNGTTFRQRHP